MSLTLADDTGLPCRIAFSVACEKLVEMLKEQSLPVKVHVSLVPSTFYVPESEMQNLVGPFTRYGSMVVKGPGYIDNRPRYPPMEHVVTLTGKCRNKKELSHTFKIARGMKHRDVLPPLVYQEVKEYEIAEYGWYKKPGFDIVYAAMKVMIPDLTEIELACFGSGPCDDERQHNKLLVDLRPYQGGTDCVEECELKVAKGNSTWIFTLQCLDSDLEENIPDILEFLHKVECF